MTMVLSAEPSSSPDDPPRIKVELEAPDGGTFSSLSLTRDGVLVRRPPFVGASESSTFDYEAPFGVPVSYTASGEYLPVTTADWSEAWASLAAWSGDTADFSVSGGKARSSVTNADITRSASGTIQRLDVTSPSYVRMELLTAGDVVVASVQLDSKVTVSGTSSTSASGSGSFSATLTDGTITASAVDSSWSLSRPYAGTPTKVRIVGLGVSYPQSLSASSVGAPLALSADSSGKTVFFDTTSNLFRKYNAAGVQTLSWAGSAGTTGTALDGSGNTFACDYSAKLVRKYDSTGALVGSWTTTGSPQDVAIDGSGNYYVADYQNSLVRKFNSSGTQTASWTTTGKPVSLDLDGSGNVYVVDQTNSLVRKFNSSGTQTASWSSVGVGIAVGGSTVYVVDPTSKVVRPYSTAGVAGTTWSTTGTAYSVAVDGAGLVYVSDYSLSRIRAYTPTTPSVGAMVTTLAVTTLAYSSSASTQLDETRAWLIHPSQPSLSVAIDENTWTDTGSNVAIDTAQQTDHPQPSSVFSPPGRTRSVVYPLGPRRVGSWTLGLNVADLSGRDAILSMLADGAPLLLRSPDWDWDLPDDWYAVGDVTQNRIAAPLLQPYRHLTLPLTPVSSPPVSLVPEFTFGDLLLAAPTFADVLAMYPTFLDVLTGSPA